MVMRNRFGWGTLARSVAAVAVLATLLGATESRAGAQSQPLPPTPVVHFVIDVSGSMSGTPLAQAKQAVVDSVNALPDDVALGLRSYSGGCTSQPVTPLVPIATGNEQQLLTAVNGLSAGGGTPTSVAVSLAINELKAFPSSGPKRLVLLTDGDNQCPQTICQAVQSGFTSALDFAVFTVGLGVSSTAATDLQCAATVSNGQYFPSTTDGLPQAIADASLSPLGGQLTPPEVRGGGNPGSRRSSCSQGEAGDPVNTATGFWHQSFTDMAITDRGPGLVLGRTFNSDAVGEVGIFGPGWSSTVDMRLQFANNVARIVQENGAEVRFNQLSPGVFGAPPRITGTLSRATDGSWTYWPNRSTRYSFDAAGQLTQVADRNGLATTFTRPNASTLVVTGAGTPPRSITMTLSNGRVTQAQDHTGRRFTYSYDSAGRLVTVTDPISAVTGFVYDANGRITRWNRPDGTNIQNTYDTSGRVTTQTDGNGQVMSFDYSNPPTGTIITDARGNRTVDQYVVGLLRTRVIAQGSPAEGIWRYEYDPVSLGCTLITDPAGRTTRSTYNARGNLLSMTDPEGRTTTFQYQANGPLGPEDQPSSVTDPTSAVTTFTYNQAGELLTTSRPIGTSAATITYRFDIPGEITSVTDPTGRQTTFAYNGSGDQVATTDPAGNATTWTYDSLGRKLTERLPTGRTTTWAYNARDDITTVTDPAGAQTQFSLDTRRRLAAATDPSGAVTSSTFDGEGRVTAVDRPDGTRIQRSYDSVGNLTSHTDGGSSVTRYTYDARNRATQVTDPLDRVTAMGFDNVDNVTSMTGPDGRTTSLTYNRVNQLTRIDHQDLATPDVTIEYDSLGRRTTMVDGTGQSDWTYDSLGRLTSSIGSSRIETRYEWDLAGRPLSVDYPDPGGVVTYGYDSAGRGTTVTDWLGNTNSWSWDSDDRLATRSAPGNVATTYAYDQVGRSSGISTTGPSPFRFEYAYDIRSLLGATVIIGLGAISFEVTLSAHDLLGRVSGPGGGNPAYSPAGDIRQLDGASRARDLARQLCWTAPGLSQNDCTSPPTSATVYTHDINGNRTVQRRPDNTQTRYLYDQAQRLTSVRNEPTVISAGLPGIPGSPWLVVPLAGLILAAGWFVSRKSSRRLVLRTAGGLTIALLATSCVPPTTPPSPPGTTTLASYTYRGDGLLTTRVTPAEQSVRFTWDDSGGTPKLLQIGATSLIYGPDGDVISRVTASVAVQVHTDRLGSVITTTNTNGTRAALVAYNAWGVKRSPTGNVGPLGFTGEYTDPVTGFVYLRARWYDPATAEFITRDPAESQTGDPYSYAANSPLAFTDPWGLWPLPVIAGAIGGVVGAVVGAASYGVDVLTSDRDFSWRELGANTAGGAVGGAAAGACVTVTANPALCGAAGAAASNVVRTSLSGEERFSPGGFAVETLAGGALGLGAGRLFETVPRLRINPNWFKPSNIRNVWNPGPWSRRAYAQSGIEAGAGALGGFGTRSLVGC
jgi:RHS repeat-associated protein